MRLVHEFNAQMAEQSAARRGGDVPEFSGGDPVIMAPLPGDKWKWALKPYVQRRRTREGDDGQRRQRRRTEADEMAGRLGDAKIADEEDEVDEKGAPRYREVRDEAEISGEPDDPPPDEQEPEPDSEGDEPDDPRIDDLPYCAICNHAYDPDDQDRNNLRAILKRFGEVPELFLFLHAKQYYDEHIK